jgi:hypothetical protein
MLRAVGRATVADHVTIDVVGASLAVGVYRRLEFAAIVMGGMMVAAVDPAVAMTAAMTAMR